MVQSNPETQREGVDATRSAAMQRAQAKLGFFRHLLTYALVIGALCAINLATAPQTLWFLWPAVGWGIAIIVHAVNVFAFSDKLLERMTDRELHRGDRSP